MRSTRTTVGTTATLLVAEDDINREIYIHAISNTTFFLGDSTVTSSNGLIVEKDDGVLHVMIPVGESLYAIVASGTESVSVLLPDA